MKFIAVLLLSLSIIGNTFAAECTDARSYIVKIADGIFKVVTTKQSLDKQREILVNNFADEIDFNWNGRAVAGVFWREMTDDKKKVFVENYKQFIIRTWMPKFKGYQGEKYQILENVDIEGNDNIVHAIITTKNQTTINIDLRVRMIDGTCKIIDVSAEGIGIARTYNAQFADYMSQYGVDECINYLKTGVSRQKNTKNNSK